MRKNDHYKISPIAVLCARAEYTNMPYVREIFTEIQKSGERG
jgi:hypothetical protein